MISAFGVDHGEISKMAPYPGGKWGANADKKSKRKTHARYGASVATSVAGGGATGIGLASGNKKLAAAGAGLGLAGMGAQALGTKRDVKRGVISDPREGRDNLGRKKK